MVQQIKELEDREKSLEKLEDRAGDRDWPKKERLR